MPLFRVTNHGGSRKMLVCATNYTQLREAGARKLELNGAASSYTLYDADGSCIDDDECLQCLVEIAANKGEQLTVTFMSSCETFTAVERSPVSNLETTEVPSDENRDPSTPLHRSVSSRATVDGLRNMLPVRTYVSDLKEALKSPSHKRNAALTVAKRHVARCIAQRLKGVTLSPGDTRKLCESIRSGCPGAFLLQIKDTDTCCFDQFLKSVYNACNYAREISGTPRRRRRRVTDTEDPDDPGMEVVSLLCVDSNGCAEGMWDPPLDVDEANTQELARLRLCQYSFMAGCEVDENALEDVRSSFALQRQHINSARSANDWRRVFAMWPILQRQTLFLIHADLLLGKNSKEMWLGEMASHESLRAFMMAYVGKTKGGNVTRDNRVSKIEEYINESVEAEISLSSKTPVALATFPFLATYFQEKCSDFFLVVNPFLSDKEVLEMAAKQSHCPLLIVKGLSLFDAQASTFVVVRGQFLLKATSVLDGALIVLLAYFVFNITYPKTICRTLEFLQRYFLHVNPKQQGRREGSKKLTINPRVSSPAAKLLDFEATNSRWQNSG